MVEELLGNSLDKAYGKQGNPCSPGWANSQAACLEPWMRAEPSVLCQGLSFPQHQQRQLEAPGARQMHPAKGLLWVPQSGVLE